MEITLRSHRQQDFDTLWSIDQKCFAPGIAYSRAELAAYLRHYGSFAFIAERSGAAGQPPQNIVGFVVAEVSRREIGHIITIDVLPEVRRFRIGSRLMDAAEARLRTEQCRAVFLETAVDNVSALAFYKRQRYSVVKTVPRYYSNGVDAFVLQKDLLSSSEAS